jgi:predicted permease
MDREIEAELQAHLELRIDDNVASGMNPAEARRDALLRFGNPVVTRERVASADASMGLADLGRDLRYATRQLRRSPGFAVTAILTLALGIGASVVVFGVLNALLLKPLDVAGSERLFEVIHRAQGDDNQSYPDFVDFRARNSAFEEMAAYRINIAGMSTGGTAQKTWGYEVSGGYFDMLGVEPEVGRIFHASDEHGPNSAPYIVLSDSFWKARFNGDPRVIGTVVDLNKHPFTIIGVAPKRFHGTELFLWPDFYMPMVNEEQVEGYSYLVKRGNHGLFMLGMLKPGVTPQQGADNLNAIAKQMERENPAADDGLFTRLVKPGLMADTLGGPAHPFLTVIMGLALLVLVAACVNLAGIFAARTADRSRELAIRLSIGSTRGRIVRQLLTEAVLISMAGGVAGTGIAAVLLAGLSRWQPIAEIPIRVSVVPDARVYALAFVLAVLSGLLPGLLVARQVWRTEAMQAMRSSIVTGSMLRRVTVRDALLVVQIALCALLVTASLVSLRGMERSLHAPVGFVPEGAMLAEADLKMAGYSDASALPVQRRMLDEAARIAGVTAVGTINDTPMSGSASGGSVYRAETVDLRSSNAVFEGRYFTISPGYLKAAETRLLAGRDFTWDDDRTRPRVAIVNQTFARSMFGNASAIGQHFKTTDKTLYEIVGVVEDGKYESLTEEAQPAMYYALPQALEADTTLVVRSRLTTGDTAAALSRVLKGVDAGIPFLIESWPEELSLALFPARAATVSLGVMGLLAAMLAITGVFGMAAYSVSKRLRELGIRAALGARRPQLMRSALGRPVLLLVCGSVAGLALGIVASRVLAFLVYSATPRDPLVVLGAVLTMVAVGVVATWIPARRALGVNPAQLLREE